MFKIGLDRADFDVLLDVLKGRHGRSRGENAQHIACLALIFIGLAVVAGAFISDQAARTGWYFWLGLAVIAVMTQGLLSLIGDLWTTFDVDSSGIRKVSPFKFLSWHVRVSELHLVELDITRGAMLIIRTVDDRKRSMPLFKSAEKQLQTLYPQLLGPTPTSASLSFRVRPGIIVFAIVALALVAALAWYLTEIGLTSWR